MVAVLAGSSRLWLLGLYAQRAEEDNVLNRARLYRDRRDFLTQPGDTGQPEDYPLNPPRPLTDSDQPPPIPNNLNSE